MNMALTIYAWIKKFSPIDTEDGSMIIADELKAVSILNNLTPHVLHSLVNKALMVIYEYTTIS